MIIAYILIFTLAAFCFYLLSRVGELEQRIESAFAELTTLRQKAPVVNEPTTPTSSASPVLIPPSVRRPEPPPVDVPVFVSTVTTTAAPAAQPVPAGPTIAERLRKFLGDEEWETIVGGSLLNKAGALILVIGIALFLGFSFGRITPAGRAGIAFAISGGILASGAWLQGRQRYQVFARGLIGCGWAALYATAYAAYAVPAARIFQDPFAGSLGLLIVAAGMIGHSLRYRAQAVTGVAYFAAFAALAATPSSPFAVVSLIPLAVSLLYLAARFNWYSMALFGLAATYLTCISRGSSGAPLVETQALFLVYWLMFEAFDLLRTKRGVATGGVEWIYPANLVGFVGLSYLAWTSHDPENRWLAAAAGAALFLADSIARAFLRQPDEEVFESLRFGGYESSAFVSAVLGGLAIAGRVQGIWMSAGLAVEAELLYLAGVRLNAPFLRRMGIGAFAHSLARLFWEQPLGKSDMLGHEIWNQTPPAILHAVFFWLNRLVRRPNVLMSSAAVILLAAVIAVEAPEACVALDWAASGFVLLEIGVRREQTDFRIQGYCLLGAASAAAFWPATSVLAIAVCLAALYASAVRSRMVWGTSAASVALAGLLLWRVVPESFVGLAWAGLALLMLELGIRRLPSELDEFFVPAGVFSVVGIAATHFFDFAKFPAPSVWITFSGAAFIAWLAGWRKRDSSEVRDAAISVGVIAFLFGTWLVVPDPYVSIAWTALAVAALELGVTLELESLNWIALLPFALVYGRTFVFDLNHARMQATPVAMAGFYWAWYRLREESLAIAVSWLAAVPLLVLIFDEAGIRNAPMGWMIVSLVLLCAGTRFGVRNAELQSFTIAIAAFGLALANGHWLTSLVTGAGLYTAQFLAKASTERKEPIFFSIAGTLLLTAVLYDRISGSLLTVSLGLEGLALLGFGFALRERVFRLQGLALLLFCVLKLFVYDLRNLETMYRILSFIALGLILLGVSWIYTRFREHVKKLL